MMKHSNAQCLEVIYDHFSKGQMSEFLALCDDKITFQVPGKGRLSGKYDKKTFVSGFVAKLVEYSGGTLKIEIHDILASDRHGVVLATDTLTQKNKKQEYRTVHVWRFENGKPVAWYEYPRDLYQYEEIWG